MNFFETTAVKITQLEPTEEVQIKIDALQARIDTLIGFLSERTAIMAQCMLSDKQWKRFYAAKCEGTSLTSIARNEGVTKTSVAYCVNGYPALKIPPVIERLKFITHGDFYSHEMLQQIKNLRLQISELIEEIV